MTNNGLKQEGLVEQPDLEEVAELMRQVWPPPCWRYSAPLLASYEHRPGAEPATSLGYRCEGELAGYMAYLPCPVHYAGQTWRLVFTSFWTSAGRHVLKGIPVKMQYALHKKACLGKFQGVLSIFEDNSKGLRAYERIASHLHISWHTIACFHMLMGTPSLARRRLPPGQAGGCVQPYSSAWRTQCAALVAEAGRQVELARLFNETELDFLLGTRAGSRSWLWLEDGRVRGLFAGWAHEVSGTHLAKGYQVDHVLMGGLTPAEQMAFLGAIMADPVWDEIESIHLPLTKPVNEELFREAGFMKTPRIYRLTFHPLLNSPAIEKVDSFYLEFF